MTASRLVTAMEDFVLSDGAAGTSMAVSANGSREVFLVPPRYVINHIPDAAGLLRVDHAKQRIEPIAIYDQCGGPTCNWSDIQQAAQAAI
jgi:hypothetical protein